MVCFELAVVLPWMLFNKLFDIFLLCFVFGHSYFVLSTNQITKRFALLWIRLIEICSYFELILPCFCSVYVSVLLFASRGKLENQKTVLTNIAFNRACFISDAHDSRKVLLKHRDVTLLSAGGSTVLHPIGSWLTAPARSLQQMAVLNSVLTVVGKLRCFGATVGDLPIDVIQEDRVLVTIP